MSTHTIPAPDAPSEEWGQLAVSIRGWRWMLTMSDPSGLISLEWVDDQRTRLRCWDVHGSCTGEYTAYRMIPDVDDPATAGCLLELAGAPHRLLPTVEAWLSGKPVKGITSLGRAVIVDVRDQWGRWPGGEE